MKLFSRKSWRLTDAQIRADEHPYTFHKPSTQAVALLSPGDEVKLIFDFESDDPDAPGAERMWVEIKEIKGKKFKGVLDNEPAHIEDLKCGDPIDFEEKHIIQLSIDDPVPSKVDKYLPRCFVTNRVLYDGAAIGYLYREQPDVEEDSGWRIVCGDESEEYMDSSDNINFVSLGAVLNKDDRIIDLLDAPVGTVFEYDPSKKAFVSEDS